MCSAPAIRCVSLCTEAHVFDESLASHWVFIHFVPCVLHPTQANFDTKIIVSTSCDPTQGLLTCNDDGSGCSGYTSITPAVVLNAGTPYFVIIGGYSRSTPVGSGTLTITASFPTVSPTRQPSLTPTRTPTTTPSQTPTRTPSRMPSQTPTRAPSQTPTRTPSRSV